MSIRKFTGNITNPLRNADPSLHASAGDVYTEARPYGPTVPLDQPGGATSPVNDHHRWVVDPAADAAAGDTYRQVRAVFDGDLYIDEVLNPTAPDADKLVRLALGMTQVTAKPLTWALPRYGVARVPRYAFYGNVRYASLEDAMMTLGYVDEETGRADKALALFLDLGRVQAATKAPGMLPVFVGEVLGDLGEVALDSGGTGRALDFWLALGPDGGVVYPDAFYAEVARLASPRLVHFQDLTAPDWERHTELSVWSVCSPRVVLRCHDEWNHPLGQYRPADLALVRADGERLDWAYPPHGTGPVSSGMVALTGWAAGHASATLEARPHGEPTAAPLMVSAVPSATAAAASLTVPLAAPSETAIQALDPADWFPAQGGTGWDPATRTHTPVTIPAPHTPARWTNGNTVTPLVDGHAYFTDLAAELDRVTAHDHWVCQAGWWFDHTFPLALTYDPALDPVRPVGDDARTLLDHWQRIGTAGARQFLLAWDSTGGPFQLLPEGLPPGGLRDLWSSIEDYGGAAQSLFTALSNTQQAGGAYNPNAAAVDALNNLTGTAAHEAILDGRTRPAASHHAKMAAIRNSGGLVAYVGGIDLNANRVNSWEHYNFRPGTGPYHDVHCRLEGPAARDVLRTFLSRWNDHPRLDTPPDDYNGKTGDLSCAALGFPLSTHHLALEAGDDRTGGTDLVQIARTFGNTRGLDRGQIHQNGDFTTDDGYAFAPDGDFTIEAAVVGAIKRAKRYVYIEDQFLGNMKVATTLADKIRERVAARAADPEHEEPFYVYILVPFFPNATKAAVDLGRSNFYYDQLRRFARFREGTSPAGPSLAGRILDLLAQQGDQPDRLEPVDPWGYLHTRWHSVLSDADPTRSTWGMHCLRLPPYKHAIHLTEQLFGSNLRQVELDDRRTYIHTKVTIVDDVWATIGSANINVRSHTGDSEINCNFIDGRADERGLRVSVRELRRQLWADHLDLPLDAVPLQAANHPDVVRFWTERTATAAADPRSGSATRPLGSRVYQWPYDDVKVDAGDPPGFSLSRGGLPATIEPFGITEIPMYWWIIEGWGKAPWPPEGPNDSLRPEDVEDLMPPPIGGDRFAFDGEDGAAYAGFDLRPHP